MLAVQRALTKLLRRRYSLSFGKWRDKASELVSYRRKTAGGIHRMRYRQLSQGWERWRVEARELRREGEVLLRGVMGIIDRWRQSAVTTWRRYANGRKRYRRRMATRLINKKLAMAWEAWGRLMHRKQGPGRAVRRWRRREEAMAWSQWRRGWNGTYESSHGEHYLNTSVIMYTRLRELRQQGESLARWRRVHSSHQLLNEAQEELERHSQHESFVATATAMEEALAAQETQMQVLSESTEAELRKQDAARRDLEEAVVATVDAMRQRVLEAAEQAKPRSKLELMLLELRAARGLLGDNGDGIGLSEVSRPNHEALCSASLLVYSRKSEEEVAMRHSSTNGGSLDLEQIRAEEMRRYAKLINAEVPDTSTATMPNAAAGRSSSSRTEDIERMALEELQNYTNFVASTAEESSGNAGVVGTREEAGLREMVIELCHAWRLDRRHTLEEFDEVRDKIINSPVGR